MKCEYCGNEWERSKYSDGCKSCYAPKPKPKPIIGYYRGKPITDTTPYEYALMPSLMGTVKIKSSNAEIIMTGGGGGGGDGRYRYGGYAGTPAGGCTVDGGSSRPEVEIGGHS